MAALRRIACHQIERALRQTAALATDDAVHQLRRWIKHLRAVIALANNLAVIGTGPSAYQARAIHRSLAPARDHRVLADLITELYHHADMAGLEPVLERLAAANDTPGPAPLATTPLLAARRALARLPASIGLWTHDDATQLSPATGLDQSITAVTQAMQDAQSHDSGKHFHRWRRRIKTLIGQLGLFTWTPTVAAIIPAMGAIGHDLGQEHDLSLLSEQSANLLSPSEHHRLTQALGRRQRTMRQRALMAGRDLRPVLANHLLPTVMQAWADGDERSFTSAPSM